MDRDELLAQIYVKTDDNRNTSLEAMKNSKENESSGLLTPFRVTSGARLISPLSDTLIKSLTGFLYVTTAEQSKDPHFHVYDVDRFQIIETKENRNSTLVF
uniref:Uncharacterized protein n=1 Tax=Caenorhabditis tropicalis TaxID=1561998 RepID=A0A1I7UBG9_9PELO